MRLLARGPAHHSFELARLLCERTAHRFVVVLNLVHPFLMAAKSKKPAEVSAGLMAKYALPFAAALIQTQRLGAVIAPAAGKPLGKIPRLGRASGSPQWVMAYST
jgi:hypothetical protein